MTPQERILVFVAEYRGQYDCGPSSSEIAEYLGYRHHESARALVDDMVKAGLLRRSEKPKSLNISTPDPTKPQPCNP